ncbi:amidohydrolase family protein [Breznakiella homolactica]|uniref:Amidohydrolase family protein n=1 Tax=Breznakiella homolactica TaxID=2798577 RepID=A0A7T8BBW2_9SPIR|nr:amidohydrolase family protein [Breznakiella homolactica]
MLKYSLKNGVVVTPGKKAGSGTISISGEKLVSAAAPLTIDLGKKSFIYPALINTHDHMRGNYLPRVGPPKGVYYMNWLPWDNDLKASETYTERSNISDKELYQLSTYKNLFSGVTTVNDHFPQAWNKEILPHLPIRAILEYGLAHECSSYDLKWGDGIEVEHTRAIKKHWPFITHLSEGFDRESMDGVITLENLKVLDSHCLLIHCIGFSDEDIKKVANAGASISWCGASNIFMFNVTCKIRKFIKAGINVTIGTDSSHTGSFNLFEEMHYDRELYRQMYGEDLPAKKIFEMVTINAAKAFWLDKKLGSLDEGKLGDILLLKAKKDDPYENFASAGMKDIELLTMAGKPLYGEMRFIDIFGGKLPEGYTEITVGGRPMFIAGDPAALYREARKKVGFKKKLDYLPFEPEA